MVLTLDLFKMVSPFTTVSRWRGEPHLLAHTTMYSCFKPLYWCFFLSAAHLVQVGSTATGVQLSFSAELVEQTAARAQWSVRMLHWHSVMYTCTLEHQCVHLYTIIYSPPPPFMIIHPYTFPQSTSSSCPRLLPALSGDGRYYLHEGLGPQDESLVLRGENLLMAVSDRICC